MISKVNRTTFEVVIEIVITVPCFAHSGVKDRGLVTGICSNEKNPIGLFDSGDGRVQQVVGAKVGSRGFVHGKGFLSAQRLAAQTVEQVFQGNQRLKTKTNVLSLVR